MEASRAYLPPLRIEVAASQIEGGQAVGWVDADRVAGCVAFSEPRDGFERFALPHLLEASPDGVPAGNLPAGVAALVAGLKAAHLRLFRENHSLMKEPKWVWVTAAFAGEGRIYFVKTQASWIYLLRGGRAFQVGGDGGLRPAAVREEALGGHEKLRLQVTSLEVTREDTVLLVVGDAEEPPDLRAVNRLYSESRDMKRACDGLVNLLGLQGPSAAVVAFRFTPLLSGAEHAPLDTARGEEVLGEIADMAREIVLAAQEGPAGAGPTTVSAAGEAAPVQPARAASDATPPERGAEATARSAPPVAAPLAAQTAATRAATLPASAVRGPAVPPTRVRLTRTLPGAPGRGARRWAIVPLIVLLALLGMLALTLLTGAGWPGALEKARGWLDRLRGVAVSAQTLGLAEFTSDPPGATVIVDGERVAGVTPLTGVRLRPGEHEVTMQLGLAGVHTAQIDVERSETAKVHAAFAGTLEVRARAQNGPGQVWLAGQGVKQALPASFAQLPAGWHRLFFEDDRLPLWERKVLVRSGEVTRIDINNAFDATRALVRVESLHLLPGEGLRQVIGVDSVFVDRSFAGLAPIELEVVPGYHAVRVAGGGDSQCTVLELPAGASQVVAPSFGQQAHPSFRHQPPAQANALEPVRLAVEIRHPSGGLRQPQLLLPDGFGGPRALPLVQTDSPPDVYVGVLPVTPAMVGRTVQYYFSVVTREGEEAVSELFAITPVPEPSDLSAVPSPRSTPGRG